MSLLSLIRKGRAKRFPGCVETFCRETMRHARCEDCGQVTDSRRMRIEEGSMRRYMAFVCGPCDLPGPTKAKVYVAQKRLAEARTNGDWNLLSSQPESDTIIEGRMPEQYNGPGRAAVRAFWKSGAQIAAVPGQNQATLMTVIHTLGLSDHVYAEQRDGETVLRRTAAR